MSVTAAISAQSFVLLPLGSRRIALPAESVIELVTPSKLQNFPHATPWISGVLVRRSRIVPVCDVSKLFGEQRGSVSRFYLIAEWSEPGARDWCAIPVCGECELASAEMEDVGHADSTEARDSFVRGFVAVENDKIEVVDLARAIRLSGNSSEGFDRELGQ